MSKIKRDIINTVPASHGRAGSEPLQFVLHDLQTPVAVLELSLAVLDSDLASAQPDTHATLRDAQRAARRIREYIDHFVSSEIFGEATLRRRRRRVELRALLDRLVEESRSRWEAAGVALDVDLPGRAVTCVRADEVLLERLFQNLLEVFVADLAPGGRVAIHVRGGSVAEIRLCRDVLSEGPGRDFVELMRDLVDLTEQAADAPSLGLPLGLRVCQQVIESHAGTMALEELADGRLCLVVRLPAASL